MDLASLPGDPVTCYLSLNKLASLLGSSHRLSKPLNKLASLPGDPVTCYLSLNKLASLPGSSHRLSKPLNKLASLPGDPRYMLSKPE